MGEQLDDPTENINYGSSIQHDQGNEKRLQPDVPIGWNSWNPTEKMVITMYSESSKLHPQVSKTEVPSNMVTTQKATDAKMRSGGHELRWFRINFTWMATELAFPSIRFA